MNELDKLAEFIVNFKLDNAPSEAVDAAKICILDSFGAAVGACKDELIESIVEEYKLYYPNENQVNIWGKNIKMPLFQGIFLNALMGHRLELDDVHTKSKTHIGTVVVPTGICLAQALYLSGSELLEAVICGYETMSRIGMGFGVSSHRKKGWHVTSTAGTFGAAAVASKLLKLDVEKTVYALGMAGTQSFGLWAFLEDSASSKILHPARAAQSGAEAAVLARSGMTGPRSILTAKDGSLFRAMSDEYDLSLVSKDLGSVYEILNVDNKPYPCCRSTHCVIDSAIKLREEYDIDVNAIDEIIVETYQVGYMQCGVTEGSKNPKTATEAKFSAPYTFAVAFLKGNVTLEDFKLENIAGAKVRELLRKVTVLPNEEFTNRYPEHWGCKSTLRLFDGTEYTAEVADALGSVYNPMSKKAVKNKVIPLLKVGYDDAENMTEKILNIEECPDLTFIW